MSLYRQYRPQDFEALMGQEHVCEVLQGALKQDRVSHAYLFTGPRGTGKTSTARILARAINCLKPSPKGPCNSCEICSAGLEERLTDLVEIDAASHGLVDDARALVEQAKFMPVQAKKKIYIIDEVHMLSKSAFNALLKIIEEPPEHVHFILATTEAHKVLETITSRCQRFDFHLADQELLIKRLQEVCAAEKAKPSEDALALLAKHARGSFRDALSLLEQVIGKKAFTVEDVQETLGLSERMSVDAFLKALLSQDQQSALDILHDLYNQGLDLYQFCQALLESLRESLLRAEQAQQVEMLKWVDIFFVALDQLRDPVVPELPLEMAVLKCLARTSSVSSTPVQPAAVPASKPAAPLEKEVGSVKAASVKKTSSQQEKVPDPVEAVSEEPSKPAEGIRMVANPQDFDKDQFVLTIKQASLKTLVKYSQVSYDGEQLHVLARSEFELSKLKAKENHAYLVELLQSFLGERKEISFGIAEAVQSTEDSSDGLSVQDLESVF